MLSDALPGCAIRTVDGRAFLFAPHLSEVFGLAPSVVGGDPAELSRARADLDALGRHGWLVPHRPRETVSEVRLLLTTQCNLACTYCNVEQGTYGAPPAQMTFATARAAIERLAPDAGRFDVVFFGGEPLLGWKVLVETARWVRRRSPDVRLVVVTNGTLVDDDKAAILAELEFEVMVSVDGDAATHDARRVDHRGRGSHAAVTAGLDALDRAGVRPTLLGTHAPAGPGVAAQLGALGALGRRRLPVIVSALEGDRDSTFASESRAAFRSAALAGDVPGALVPFLRSLVRGAHGADASCPAGANTVTTPAGEIYPCHVAADRKLDRIGALGEDFDETRAAVRDRYGARAAQCTTCWANGLCSGGCPLRRSRGLGPTPGDCTWSQDRIEHAAYLADVLPFDRLDALVGDGASASDRSALRAGLMLREHFRYGAHALWPLSIPSFATAA